MKRCWLCLAVVLLLAVPGTVRAECPPQPRSTDGDGAPCHDEQPRTTGAAVSGGEFQLSGAVDRDSAGLRSMGGDFGLTVTKGVDLPGKGPCGCLCFGLIFGDGFESGDTSEWSFATP